MTAEALTPPRPADADALIADMGARARAAAKRLAVAITAEKAAAGEKILARFDYLADTMQGDYLFGDRFSAADAYLFVMLRWAAGVRLSVPEKLVAYRDRIAAREAVREAVREVLAEEGLA